MIESAHLNDIFIYLGLINRIEHTLIDDPVKRRDRENDVTWCRSKC